MPTGCLRMTACVRPPKRTAGGPTRDESRQPGIFARVCVEERQKLREDKEDGVDFKVKIVFFFFKRPHLARNESKIENMSDGIWEREESLPAHVVCAQPRSAFFKFLLGKHVTENLWNVNGLRLWSVFGVGFKQPATYSCTLVQINAKHTKKVLSNYILQQLWRNSKLWPA